MRENIDVLHYGIALSGGIASGKSTVSSLLKSYNFEVIDADSISHRILNEQEKSVLQCFGDSILNQNGNIDRKKLGAIVFANQIEREKLEEILHPHIREAILQESIILNQKNIPFFVDIPIFFEKPHLFSFFKKNLLIYAPQSMQITRLMQRNQLSKKEALQRIEAQINIEQKCLMAQFIIKNDSSLDNLQHHLQQYIQLLRSEYGL
ncbi:dephospho-CoA kinase [Helicobacter monodelphidis]|uniref:dephospho-CoA kinase n=1 Tax=Helicobacter sp. 15-1451 TaxID=2004995 RepID=UPI000DCB0FB5|nr:dephospho-CoA kinase [Helicobacter sp. 15-1451]RAX58332.1 dephospho-CoA kinase [Helicobacter sp. 15-1451]